MEAPVDLRGPRAVQTADPWRNVNIMLALLISPDWPLTTGGVLDPASSPSSPLLLMDTRPSLYLAIFSLITSSSFLFLSFSLFPSLQRLTWLTTCCRLKWGRDTASTRPSVTPGYRWETGSSMRSRSPALLHPAESPGHVTAKDWTRRFKLN